VTGCPQLPSAVTSLQGLLIAGIVFGSRLGEIDAESTRSNASDERWLAGGRDGGTYRVSLVIYRWDAADFLLVRRLQHGLRGLETLY